MASGNFSNYNITITINIPNVKNLNLAINSALSGINKTVTQTKNVSSNINKINTNLIKARRQSTGFLKDWERMTIVANQLAELTRKFVLLFNFISKPVSEAGAFEQFRVTLKNLLGDIDSADNRFKEMVRFAAKTPFNVPGIVEAGNRLQSIGQYSIKTIEMLGDLAAASGKDVSQAIEAYTNLVVGRTGMAVKQFRALLISNLDWSREIGKQVLKNTGETTASVQEMLDALPRIIAKKGFSKLMEEQSKTLNGIISNFEDALQRAYASIGEKIMPKMKKLYLSLIEFLDSIEKNANKVHKIMVVLGEALYLVSLIYGLKQILKIIKFIGLQSTQLKRFFVSFKTSAITIGQSLNSLFFQLKLIKGTIEQSTIASIKFGTALKTAAGYIVTATKASITLLGKIGFIILTISAIVDLIKSAKNVFEVDLNEKIENTQEAIDFQKNYREEQKEQLKLQEERISALEEVIRVEKKYSQVIKEKEQKLKDSNVSEEEQKIVLQQTREEIKEYNTALDKLKSVYPELVGQQNEFSLANKDNKTTLSTLSNELEKSKSKFSELGDRIIKTTEAIANLTIELAKLNLEKQFKESTDKINEMLNNLPVFKDIIKEALSLVGFDFEKSSEDFAEFFEHWSNIFKVINYKDVGTIKVFELFNKYFKSLDTENIEESNKQMNEMLVILNELSKKEFKESFLRGFLSVNNYTSRTYLSSRNIEELTKAGDILYDILLNSVFKLKESIGKVKQQYSEGFRDFFSSAIEYHKKFLYSIDKDDKTVLNRLKENLTNIEENYKNLKPINIEVSATPVELQTLIAKVPKDLTFYDNEGREINVKEYLSEQLEQQSKGKEITEQIEITLKIPNLKDQSKALQLAIAEYLNNIDTSLSSLDQEQREVLNKRKEEIKEFLTKYELEYENIINEFRKSTEETLNENISKKPIKTGKEFLQQTFEYYNETFKKLQRLIENYEKESGGLKKQIENIEKISGNLDFGLLDKFNSLNKKFSKSTEETTRILSETIEEFKNYVVDIKKLSEFGLRTPSEIGFQTGSTEELVNFLENFAKNINKLIKILKKLGIEFDDNKLLENIKTIYDTIDQLKNKLREEKITKIKLEDLFKILPLGASTKEQIKSNIEKNILDPIKNLSIDKNYKISVKYDIEPVITEEAKKNYEEIIKNDLNYLLTKINEKISDEESSLSLVINSMKKNNESEYDINKRLISEYEERINYLYEIIELIRNTKTEEEQELISIKNRIAELEKLRDLNNVLTKEQNEELENIKIKEDEVNKVLLEKESIINQIIELIKKLGFQLAEITQKNEDSFSELLNKVMQDVLLVYNAIYDNLNKIGQTYFENMINNAKKEAEIFLELQNKKIDADEKLANNYARTELQREKVKERMDEKRRQAQEKARKMEMEARRKQFEFEKKMAVAQALMNIAVAVTKIFAQTGALGFFIAAGVEAFLNAVYIPMILSQEFPEYQKGGYTGDLKEDEPVGIVHGREFVVNASATKKHRLLLDKINQGKLDDNTYKKGGYVGLNKNDVDPYIEESFKNVKKLKDNINSINEVITNIGRKEIYNIIKLKVETDKINIKGQFNEFDKQIISSKNRAIKLPTVNNKINISNDSLLSEIKSLNNNLKYYLENPSPAIAYLNENEAEKITKVGFKKIQRKLI